MMSCRRLGVFSTWFVSFLLVQQTAAPALAQTDAKQIAETISATTGVQIGDTQIQIQADAEGISLRGGPGPNTNNFSCETPAFLYEVLENHSNLNAPQFPPAGIVPACGGNLDDRYAVWYVYQNATTPYYHSLTTCHPETNFPTVIDVFCALDPSNPCNTLSCIASSDSDPKCASGDATVSWLGLASQKYWIRVRGVGGARGTFKMSHGGSSATPPPNCSECDIEARPTDILMTEPCGSATNETCGATGVQTVAPGQVLFGNSFVDGGTAHRDVIRFGPFPNVNDIFAVAFEAEHPAAIEVRTVTSTTNCLNDVYNSSSWYTFFYEPCGKRIVDPGSGFVFNPRVGYIYVRVIPGKSDNNVADTYGLPCNAGNNDYRISLSTNHLGACCIGAFCTAGVMQAACAIEGGVYLGDNTTCVSKPCQAPMTGPCCTPGACTILTPEACTAAGGSYAGHGLTCTGWNKGNPTLCCPANFDQVDGVAVSDLFAYITAWLKRHPSTNFNGDSVIDVADLFEYINIWLARCDP